MLKQTRITVETQAVWVVHRPAGTPQGWCEQCSNWVALVTPDEAAQLTGQSVRSIFRQIEEMQLHFIETPTGNVWLCLPTLLTEIQTGAGS